MKDIIEITPREGSTGPENQTINNVKISNGIISAEVMIQVQVPISYIKFSIVLDGEYPGMMIMNAINKGDMKDLI